MRVHRCAVTAESEVFSVRVVLQWHTACAMVGDVEGEVSAEERGENKRKEVGRNGKLGLRRNSVDPCRGTFTLDALEAYEVF